MRWSAAGVKRFAAVVLGLTFVAFTVSSCTHGQRTTSDSRAVTLAIVGGTIVHPDGAVAPNQNILIAGERITRIGPASTVVVPSGTATFDARGKWIIPGLIDSHVHFFQSGTQFTRPDMVDLTAVVPYPEEREALKARLATTFKIWLASGVIAVADVGGPMWNFEVRDAARTTELAPYVKVAGPLVSLVEVKPLEYNDPPIIKVATADEARTLVRRQLERRPDFVKMWFIHRPEFDLARGEAIARAIGDEAHRARVPYLVHATQLETAKAALRAGADVLVHSVSDVLVDDELIALAKERSIIYIPTLWVSTAAVATFKGTFQATDVEKQRGDLHALSALSKAGAPDSRVAQRTISMVERMKNLKTVWDAGITVAMGTDAGNPGVLHGPSVFRELELMAEAGLTPAQALRSATLNGARMLGMTADLGDVAEGKLAELVILDADPLVDVKNFARIRRVIHRGKMVDPDELMRSIRP